MDKQSEEAAGAGVVSGGEAAAEPVFETPIKKRNRTGEEDMFAAAFASSECSVPQPPGQRLTIEHVQLTGQL